MTAVDVRDRPKVAPWNDPKLRSAVIQLVLLAAVMTIAAALIRNTYLNLKTLNIASGFGFLSKTAGFDIVQSMITYSSASTYGRAILVGLLNTVLIAVLGIVAATIIGFIMGVLRLSKNPLVSGFAACYIEFFRNVPLLLQIIFFYQVVLAPLPSPKQAINVMDSFFLSNRGLIMPLPVWGPGTGIFLAFCASAAIAVFMLRRWAKARQMATGQPFPVLRTSLAILLVVPFVGYVFGGFPLTFEYPALKGFNFQGGLHVIPELMALFVALAIYTGTDIAESVRAGIQAVSHGQTEAAGSLGLRSGTTLRLVVIPQALRVIIPPLASTYLSLTKNSSLAIAIGYPDIVATGGTVLNQTGQAIEIVGIWMVVYLSLSLLTSLFMNWFNARMKLVER